MLKHGNVEDLGAKLPLTIIPGDDPTITEANWLEGVRKHYAGRVILGSDLVEI